VGAKVCDDLDDDIGGGCGERHGRELTETSLENKKLGEPSLET
jgi:hypothetical protein